MREVTRRWPGLAWPGPPLLVVTAPAGRWGDPWAGPSGDPGAGGGPSKSPPCPEAGEPQGLSAPPASLVAGAGLGRQKGPPTERLPHLPPQ